MIEQIFKSIFIDVYRIKQGVLVEVRKYKHGRPCTGRVERKRIERYKYESFFEIVEDVSYLNCNLEVESFKKGEYTKEYIIITLCDKEEFEYIIKTTGSDFNGTQDEIHGYFSEIVGLMD